MQHHEHAVAAFARSRQDRPDVLGVVLVGSVARGEERPDSDVDVYLVVTDDAHRAATAAGEVALVSQDGVEYPGGYVDIKLVSPAYLRRAVDEADDPTRASFRGARIVLDSTGDLSDLVTAIAEGPAVDWVDRVAAYRAQLDLYGGYFLPQALDRGDDFLARHSAVHAATAAGRLALARHRRWFRGQKYLSADLAELDLPAQFLSTWRELLREPGEQVVRRLCALVDDWVGQPASADAMLSRFITDNELGWLSGRRPPEFW